MPIIGIFLFFQAVLIWHVQVTDYDEAVFLDIARNIQRVGLPLRSIGPEGRFYFTHTPLYLYLVTASVSLVGDNPLWARLFTTTFGVGSIILSYLIVRKHQTAVSAIIAALLLALNTFFAVYSYFLTMAVPMMFFILLAIYLLADEKKISSWHYWLGAGLAIAIAVMLKELAILFLAAAAIYALIFGDTWRKRIIYILCLLIPTTFMLSLWTWWGINLDATQFQVDLMRWVNSATGASNERALQTFTWIKVLGNTLFSWGMLILFIFSLAGYFIWFRRKLPKITWLLFLYLGLTTIVSFFVSLKEPRHVIALIPTMAMLIGILIPWETVWHWTKEKPARILIISVIFLILAWNISPLKLPFQSQWTQREFWWEPFFAQRIYHSQRYYGLLKEAGQYLAENTPPDTTIAVIHEGPVVGYYADRSHYFLYTMKYPKILDTLENTEYLVFDHQVFLNLTPEEVDSVMTYIEEEFELEQLMQDSYRETHIYRRQ